MEQKNKTIMVPAVDRATDILEYLLKNGNSSTKQIAKDLEIPIASASRIIRTLLSKEYIIEHKRTTTTYSLGIKLVIFSQAVLHGLDLDTIAKKEMKKLSEATNLVSQLAIYERESIIYTQNVMPSASVSVVVAPLRVPMPVNLSAGGKAIMSQMNEETLNLILENCKMEKATKNSILDKNKFKENLKTAKSLGYAIDNEEYSINIGCIAAPIFDHEKNILAAVGVTGPINVFREKQSFEQVKNITLETAKNISRKLGFYK